MCMCMRPYGEVCVCVSYARSDRARRTGTLAPKSPDPPESRRRHPNVGCASGCPCNEKMAFLALRLGTPRRVIFLRRSWRARAAALRLRTPGPALLLRCHVGIPDECHDLRRATAPILFADLVYAAHSKMFAAFVSLLRHDQNSVPAANPVRAATVKQSLQPAQNSVPDLLLLRDD